MTTIAVEAIEDLIVSGALVAGDRINESTLADRLGVSRGPIREACRSLEQAGLLTSRTNRGMYVREISIDEAQALYELRGAVAGLVGELIVRRGADADIADLQGLVDHMQVAADTGDADLYYKLNLSFHGKLVRTAGNSAAEDVYHRIVNQLHLMRRRGLVADGNLQVSNQEHRSIVTALADRDASRSALAMRTHVANGLTRLLSTF